MSATSVVWWLWGIWALSWILAASWANRTEARPKATSELLYRGLTAAGILLLFIGGHHPGSEHKLWKMPQVPGWCLASLAVAGFGLCWWARVHLGRMWSSSVTRKTGHHIVDTGPYAVVRHPIYTGIILAAGATAVLESTVVAFAGLVLTTIGFWMKARLEERFLRDELGAEAYDGYARRTGMLFPYL